MDGRRKWSEIRIFNTHEQGNLSNGYFFGTKKSRMLPDDRVRARRGVGEGAAAGAAAAEAGAVEAAADAEAGAEPEEEDDEEDEEEEVTSAAGDEAEVVGRGVAEEDEVEI